MSDDYFDPAGRFVIEDYAARPPFASFLPGIAGPLGVPMWVFYVNRGQAVASFGVESKDGAVMEFQPANKTYQLVPFTGFRTWIKIRHQDAITLYEPFSPWQRSAARQSWMHIAPNELELRASLPEAGLQVSVLYFILPNESFAGLVRQVTIANCSSQVVTGEVLDGLPVVIPYGVSNLLLKEIHRTAEAWMDVFNRERGIPFYRVRAQIGDRPEVAAVEAGHFYLAFAQDGVLLPAITDGHLIFGQNTSLSYPDGFMAETLAELTQHRQQTAGKTPCGFFGSPLRLAPDETLTISAIIGHVRSVEVINAQWPRLARADYLHTRRREAHALVNALTDTVATRTGSPLFDAYCRQNLLDNVLRGGWPVILGSDERPVVYHLYSRKHGDLERDYNAFSLAAEFYSQGNGNYRDVNQNRRCDVLLNPRVDDFNIATFVNLIQADGYNPLVIRGSWFCVPPAQRAAVLALAQEPRDLERFLSAPFTPGQLLQYVLDHDIPLKVAPEVFLSHVLSHADQSVEATPGEGYWVDHWTYNLDLIESYLTVYPDRQDELLFGKTAYTFYDSPAIVQPRAEKYVLAGGVARQLGAVIVDKEKAALIAARTESPHRVRVAHGRGPVYYTTLFAKLVSLAIVKFATLDPLGMGIEMEADRPGWCDALNGLPGLFGSSMPETYELAHLVDFLLAAMREKGQGSVDLPLEVSELLVRIGHHLETYNTSPSPDRDFVYWDAVAGEREAYRARIRLGFDGREQRLHWDDLTHRLNQMRAKLQQGIDRALARNGGLPPTYWTFAVTDYEPQVDAQGHPRLDTQGRRLIRAKRFEPQALPIFLEGLVRFFRIQRNPAAARRLYEQVKASDLYDRSLKMYKISASLAGQPHDIGRARAFTPGWLENESIWLHMAYKYLLAVLQAGLYDEFFSDFKNVLIPFQNPRVYGRSPLENSSFLVSSAHPDASLHGRGFVARLSGSTAEFLSIWSGMMAGVQPFVVQDGQLILTLRPVLPGWLFDDAGTVSFRFLGCCDVVYHNRQRRDLRGEAGPGATQVTLETRHGQTITLDGGTIGAPYAALVRAGQVKTIHLFFDEQPA